MAFQIIDDILDYEGTDESIKKSAANDLKQGIYTLPFIYAYKNNKASLINYMNREIYSDEEVYEMIKIVKDNDGIKKAKQLANKYMDKCFKGINKLPNNEYKIVLREIVEWLLIREY